MEKKHTVIHNTAEKRYELDLGEGDMALLEYVPGKGLVVLTHTEVPPKYEGQGIGKEWCWPPWRTSAAKGCWSCRSARSS